jgi:hypothetical protein
MVDAIQSKTIGIVPMLSIIGLFDMFTSHCKRLGVLNLPGIFTQTGRPFDKLCHWERHQSVDPSMYRRRDHAILFTFRTPTHEHSDHMMFMECSSLERNAVGKVPHFLPKSFRSIQQRDFSTSDEIWESRRIMQPQSRLTCRFNDFIEMNSCCHLFVAETMDTKSIKTFLKCSQ